MDIRKWLYDRITTSSPIITVVPAARVLGAGSAEGAVLVKPFIMIKMGSVLPELEGDDGADVVGANVEIWVHDNPGSFARIDALLKLIKERLEGPIPTDGGVACRWQGDSTELSDEGFGTITRYGSYKVFGKATS